MKTLNKACILIYLLNFSFGYSQSPNLEDFKMTNETTPTFLLLEESPTSIYTPDNVKALVVHGFKNFGESMSIEMAPYFFIKNPDRTFYNYIGIDSIGGGVKQYPFRGLNTTNISFGYIDKEFEGIEGERKTYSIGIRTTLLRFYDKNKLHKSATEMANYLSELRPPKEVLIEGEEAIKEYILSINEKEENKKIIANFKKTTKPIFRLDGAMAYSTLYKENIITSGKANRFGTWVTAEASFLLNEGGTSDYNNYFNLLLTARFIKDGFNVDTNAVFYNQHYRDYGGKVEFEFEGFAFAYEYIYRNATIKSERSVGSIRYSLTNDITISGGFGKDFSLKDNLVTLFGINWGFIIGDDSLSF